MSILVCEYVGSIVSVICVQLVAVSRKVYFSTVKNEYFVDNKDFKVVIFFADDYSRISFISSPFKFCPLGPKEKMHSYGSIVQ